MVLALSGCTSIERINQNMKNSEATDAKARQQMQKLTSPSPVVLREASRQWVNPTPMIDWAVIKKATPLIPLRLTSKAHSACMTFLNVLPASAIFPFPSRRMH
ncbi:MAG: hypothetical protein ACR5LC_08405 [Symbiopectobacterium sp.]|uniref:hypothetical protein n=1 Tax=Symbiopectobacterium sp. TaxID=2952789 RepID=UPI003F343956